MTALTFESPATAPLECLRVARERLQGTWGKGSYASTVDGHPLEWDRDFDDEEPGWSRNDCCVCVVGALNWSVTGDPTDWGHGGTAKVQSRAEAILNMAMASLHGPGEPEIVQFNDLEATTEEEILAVVDEAIQIEARRVARWQS